MDRWEHIERAYHAARDLRGDDRARYLDEQRLDDAMRRTIEALLEHGDRPDNVLDYPATGFVADSESIAEDPATLTGRSVGSYEILELIGSGGMGRVYRARDRALQRDVALKVLPMPFVLDPNRLARFRREAQILAAINHPNIGAIYGFTESDGVHALTLELVEGPTLAERIATGPIRLDEALPIARQIADALGAAHEQGIVHRDLKPANIKVRSDGTVKVLDFGLAKSLNRTVPVGGARPVAATVTIPADVGAGVLLGTAAYMSPEQATGGAADKRSDVWAFGCVLYEMLTGRRAFGGHEGSETLMRVVRDAPDWTAWPDSVPPHVRELVQGCLQKDPRDRIAAVSTAQFVLNERRAVVTPLTSQATARHRFWKSAALVATIAAVAGFLGWSAALDRKVADITRFSISTGEDEPLQGRPSLAISPDGTQLVYAKSRRLYLRSMSELDARAIGGTDSDLVTSPVFSPDGKSIAFWAGTDRTLKRVPITGGRAVTICQSDGPAGIAWNTDGILFGQSGRGIMRVSPEGGTPEVVVTVKGDEAAYAPQVLPGGRGTLFTLAFGGFLEKPRLVVQTSRGERKTLIDGASDGRYLPTGHLVYAVDGKLLAVSFDVRRLEITSTPVSIVDGVARTALNATGGVAGMAQWAVSTTGSLAYIPGPAIAALYTLALLDTAGSTERLPLAPAAYQSPRFSPDGRHIVYGINDGKNIDLWIYDLAGASPARRFTLGGKNRYPTWSPDGARVAFQSDRDGDLAIFAQRDDLDGTPERLTRPAAGTSHIPESWSSRGDVLSFSVEKNGRFSLWTLSLRDKHPTPFGAVESDIPAASAFSPDGRWLAYQMGQRSVTDVRPTAVVQPFPATGTPHQIGSGAAMPVWSADGQELLYNAAPRQWVAARLTLQPGFVTGNPRPLPTGELQTWRPDWSRHHDVSGDGRRVGMIPHDKSLLPGNTRTIHVVLNWVEELKQRVPVRVR
jgi:eukaryotic-like serine/threonine-protein kinase